MMLEIQVETSLLKSLRIRLGSGLYSWTTEVLSGKLGVMHYKSIFQTKVCLNTVLIR